jgi:hypothetical protein
VKFGTWTGVSFEHYINPVHREYLRHHSIFSLRRIPYSFADYFGLRFPPFQHEPPFLLATRHLCLKPALYSQPVSETYLPIPWSSGWLLFGAIMGLGPVLRPRTANWFERGLAAAFLIQFVGILAYFLLAQRYATDLYPFLVCLLLIFLAKGGKVLLHSHFILIGLVAVSILINSLATISWLVGADQNVLDEIRAVWKDALREIPSP